MGDVIRLEGLNRTVIYRVVGYSHRTRRWMIAWPD